MVSDRIEEVLPPDYAEALGITTVVCTPMSAAGRAYGVICADRGGGRFELSDGERHLLWTLGKTAALVATARNATRQQERARRLSERLDLAREVHERVLQRLFGVSLALSAEQPLERAERERCRAEMQEALADLRRALERPLAPLPPETGSTLAAQLERVCATPQLPLAVNWPATVEVPGETRAARPVGARRGAAQHRQARRAHPRRGERRSRRRHVHARGPQRRGQGDTTARAGWASAWPASKRCSRVEWSSSGRPAAMAGGYGWSCRCGASRDERRQRQWAGGSGSWSSTTTTSSIGVSACCSASSRGWSAAWRRAPAPKRSSSRGASSPTSHWSTCSSPGSRAPSSASRSARHPRRPACF